MFEKKEPTFLIQNEKQCAFCKKLINYETRICPFCESQLVESYKSGEKIEPSINSAQIKDPLINIPFEYAGF
jgi:RNA polymerase subunit RPABC4/transcription elongation factor Spt4